MVNKKKIIKGDYNYLYRNIRLYKEKLLNGILFNIPTKFFDDIIDKKINHYYIVSNRKWRYRRGITRSIDIILRRQL